MTDREKLAMQVWLQRRFQITIMESLSRGHSHKGFKRISGSTGRA